MFISWRTFTATFQAVQEFTFACAHCGLQAPALVQSVGTGSSDAAFGVGEAESRMQAQASAPRAAYIQATWALRETTCPRCGAVPLPVVERVETFTRSLARKKRVAFPAALAISALVALALAYPAIVELRHTPFLLWMAAAFVVGAFGVTYAFLGWPPSRPVLPRANVFFRGTRPDGIEDWVPAAPGPVHGLPYVRPRKAALATIAGIVFAIVGAVMLLFWHDTFKNAFIFDAGPLERAKLIVDGKEVDRTGMGCKRCVEGPVDVLTVRTTADHVVELVNPDGTRFGPFTLSKDAKFGWLIAPEAKVHDACFHEFEVVYGGERTPAPPRQLDLTSGFLTFPHYYDDVFVDPPRTVSAKSGETVTRRELRAVHCTPKASRDTNL